MDLDWIRSGLHKPGKTQRGLAAALGVDASAVSRLLAGTRQLKAAEIAAVARYLEIVPPAAIPPVADPTSNAAPLAFAPSAMQGPRNLPVVGTAVAGHDGMFLMNGQIHDYIERPPSLQGVAGAYAVYVADRSMEPRYFAGETLHVHPGRPIPQGDNVFVVVQLKPDAEGEPPKALVKQFVRRTANRLVLRQYNPPAELAFDTTDIASVHLIIWAGRG
jgi:phage repressor protein C with HTH and peptisase S24 domain